MFFNLDLLKNPTRFLKNLSSTGGDWVEFTPVIEAVTTDPTYTVSYAEGLYTTLGRVVIATGTIHVDTVSGAGTGLYLITVPVSIHNNDTNALNLLWGHGEYVDASATQRYSIKLIKVNGIGNNNQFVVTFVGTATSGVWQPGAPANLSDDDELRFTAAYAIL